MQKGHPAKLQDPDKRFHLRIGEQPLEQDFPVQLHVVAAGRHNAVEGKGVERRCMDVGPGSSGIQEHLMPVGVKPVNGPGGALRNAPLSVPERSVDIEKHVFGRHANLLCLP